MFKFRALLLGAALGLAAAPALAADPGLTDKEITIGLFNPLSVSYTHLTLPTNREV